MDSTGLLPLLQFISANMCGNLTLRVETETVAVSVLYSNLRNHLFGEHRQRKWEGGWEGHLTHSTLPVGGDEDGSQGRAEAVCEACVDIKRFSQVLSSQFVPTKAICSECPLRALVLLKDGPLL